MINSRKLNKLIKLHQTPTLFLSKKAILKAYIDLEDALPHVNLYYAIKANNHPQIIETLAGIGANFDVCSNDEIDFVKKNNTDDIKWIHTHPIKTQNTISYSYRNGVRTFVVDNILELNKLIKYRNEICVLVRMSIENTSAKIDFSKKFGTIGAEATTALMKQAKKIGFKKIGISFHCGSQAIDPEVFNRALLTCKEIILKLKEVGIKLSIVDIGGGFTDQMKHSQISDYCKGFKADLNSIHHQGIKLIAEPGRFIAEKSMFLATKIIGKSKRRDKIWYYIDDSVYNSFSGMVYDHMDYPLSMPKKYEQKPKTQSVIAGQTCDSIDIIKKDILLPDLPIGTVLLFKNMGAYTSVSASTFNGFPKTKIITIN